MPNIDVLFESLFSNYDDIINSHKKRRLSRRIMLDDTFEDDYMEFIECNRQALCGA